MDAILKFLPNRVRRLYLGGSGIDRAEARMRARCPGALWRKGRLISGAGAAEWARGALEGETMGEEGTAQGDGLPSRKERSCLCRGDQRS